MVERGAVERGAVEVAAPGGAVIWLVVVDLGSIDVAPVADAALLPSVTVVLLLANEAGAAGRGRAAAAAAELSERCELMGGLE